MEQRVQYTRQTLLLWKSAEFLVKDITKKLPSLVWPLDYYLLLVFHVGDDEATIHNPRAIKRDFRVLGVLLRESGAQVIFSSTLPVASSDTGRNRYQEETGLSLLIHGFVPSFTTTILGLSITEWHQAYWCQMGFIFLKGGRVSLHELVGLTDRVLN